MKFKVRATNSSGTRRGPGVAPKPPVLANFLLYLFLPSEAYNCIRGDLTEEFYTIIVPSTGSGRAWYWHQVVRTIGPALRGEIASARPTNAKGDGMIRNLLQDVRFGIRMLLKQPGFTAVAILALALGIGANTAIFSIVNALLIKPLPYAESNRLVWLSGNNLSGNIDDEASSGPDFLDWESQNRSFEQLTCFNRWQPTLNEAGEPERIPGGNVTANFFQVLGANAAIGRTFLRDEQEDGKSRVVVISNSLWQRRFGADPNIQGKLIVLNGNSFSIVGVMPAGFLYPSPAPAEIWTPIVRSTLTSSPRRADGWNVIGRLKPGITIQQARSEMNSIAEGLEKQYPATNTGWRVNADLVQDRAVKKIRPALWVLLGAVAFLLLIACANVSNLLLVRATARQREIAVRTALGATRWRIARQLLTESVLLALGGGIAGLLLAYWGVKGLMALSPANMPLFAQIGIDRVVLCFTLAVSVVTGVVFGLAPAFQSQDSNLNETLKEGGRGSSQGGRSGRIRGVLTVAEVSLALVLLIGAGLMVKSFIHLQNVNPGFKTDRLLTVQLSLPRTKYDPDHASMFYQQLLEQVKAVPGVLQSATTSDLPLSGGNYESFAVIGRAPLPPDTNQDAELVVVSPDYFQTMGIPLLKGRLMSEQDRMATTPVVVISESMARKYWPGEDPIGQQITFNGKDNYEIVGLVGGTRDESLDAAPYAQVFATYLQAPQMGMTLVVRSAGEPLSLVPDIRRVVSAVDKDQPLYNVRTMEQVLASSVTQQRLNMLLLTIFALVALILAGVGIYGVMSYSVRQRTHEIGVRMALGARRRHVLRLIVVQGMTLSVIGVGIGLVASFCLTRLMANLLFGVSVSDPATFVSISFLIVGVSLMACVIPAMKATRVDPMDALRYE